MHVASYPSLNSRSFACKEAEAEMTRLLAIQGKPIYTLGWIGGDKVFQEDICETEISNVRPCIQLKPTKIFFRASLELFMDHELFYSASHSLHMVDDQF